VRASVTASLPLSISLTLDQVDATQVLRPRGDRRRPIGVSHTAGNVRAKAIVIDASAPAGPHERLVAKALAQIDDRLMTKGIASDLYDRPAEAC
jgi:hypothetical protein